MAFFRLSQGVKALALSALCALGVAAPTSAAVYTIGDTGQNSSIVYDTSSGIMEDWFVEGIDNLFNRSLYYRVGPPAIGNPELAINDTNLILSGANTFDNNFIPGDEGLSLLYADPSGNFAITLVTTLTGATIGSNNATFTQNIRIDNLGRDILAMSLILYADYDMLSSDFNDAVAFTDPRTVTQVYDTAVHEAAVTVLPTHIETSYFSTLFTSLNDGDSTTLDGNTSLFSGDLVYGYQWDILIKPGRSFTLGSSNSLTVPEVSTVTMLGIAGLGLAGLRLVRRRK